MEIKELFKKVRKENNLTQEKLAEMLNISRSSIALYEKGIRKPDVFLVNDICKRFDVKLDNVKVSNNKNKKEGKSFTISSIVLFVIAFLLEACHVVDINNKYGYNIYNDKLKVENSSNICIVRVDSVNNFNNKNKKYKYTIIEYIKKDIYYHFKEDEILISNKLSKFKLNYYLIFINKKYYQDSDKKADSSSEIEITHLPFIKELEDYDESLKYNEQTGKCKSVIDYYINLINDK